MTATRLDDWGPYGPASERDRAGTWHRLAHAQPCGPLEHDPERRERRRA